MRQARDIYRYKPTTEVIETAELCQPPISRNLLPGGWRRVIWQGEKTLLENLDIKQLKQMLLGGIQEELELAAYILGEIADTRNAWDLIAVAEDIKQPTAARIKAIEALGKASGPKKWLRRWKGLLNRKACCITVKISFPAEL